LSEPYRTRPPRLAAVLLLMGAGILIASVAMMTYGERDVREAARKALPQRQEGSEHTAVSELVLVRWLFWTAMLVFAVLLAMSVFVRWSRHYRRELLRRPPPPTEYCDAWAMHQAPETDEEDEQ
jgi:branched-subunit amino acid ABC-type transport system permease component